MFKRLLLTGLLLSMLSVFGKALAFIRDILFAREVGFNAQLDSYLLLFAVAMFVISIITGALNSLLASFLKRHQFNFKRFYRQFSLFSLTLSILFAFLSVYILPRFIYEPSQVEPLVYFCFVGVVAVGLMQAPLIASLTAKKQLAFLGASQLIMPGLGLAVVIVVMLAGKTLTISYIASALLIAYLVHFSILAYKHRRLSRLAGEGYSTTAKFSTKPLFKEFFWLVLSSSLLATLPLIDLGFASQLGEGKVSVLGNAYKFVAVAQSVLAMSIGSMLIPHMAEWIEDKDLLKARLTKATLMAAGLGIGVAVAMYIILPLIIPYMFQGSEVDIITSTELVNVAQLYTFLVPLYLLGMVLSRCVVSLGKARMMLLINLTAFFLNIMLDYLMSRWFGLSGIALTTSIIYLVSVILLTLLLRDVLLPSSIRKVRTGRFG
ncbi:lipid II flippase MurJ [Agarivorans aestuarii]|uniref:lipid II flippase MurJ n=1 Tax=Agarivorans aestuarii TaxID=1563703 RepID=UPI001C7FF734|nr:lipid II flippase MurJ [Agarivorans aestuarii]